MRFARFLPAAIATLCSAAAAQEVPVPQALATEVWLIPGSFLDKRQPDGNTMVFKGPAGLVVLDTGRHRWHRQAILELARSEAAPIAAIVNSHWHLDHVSGNRDLKAAYPEAKAYASNAIDAALAGFLKSSAADAREYLSTPGLPPETAEDIRGDLATTAEGAALKPDVVIWKTGPQLLAGRQMQVHLAKQAATAGDVWLYDPASRMAAVGDLVTLPVPFLDTACAAGWKAALAQVGKAPFDLLIPGHGRPMTRSEFSLYRSAFDSFMTCARSSQPAAECAAAWAKDAGPLLDANGMGRQRAEGMAAYYVSEVLRPNGGNSKFCSRP